MEYPSHLGTCLGDFSLLLSRVFLHGHQVEAAHLQCLYCLTHSQTVQLELEGQSGEVNKGIMEESHEQNILVLQQVLQDVLCPASDFCRESTPSLSACNIFKVCHDDLVALQEYLHCQDIWQPASATLQEYLHCHVDIWQPASTTLQEYLHCHVDIWQPASATLQEYLHCRVDIWQPVNATLPEYLHCRVDIWQPASATLQEYLHCHVDIWQPASAFFRSTFTAVWIYGNQRVPLKLPSFCTFSPNASAIIHSSRSALGE